METITRRVIKRNGEEVVFDVQKILNAIRKANNEVEPIHRLNEYQIEAVGKIVMDQICQSNHATAVEDIQDMVERGIMEMRGYEVAQIYVRYRYKRDMARKANTTDDGILALIDQINEEVKQENSNKNPTINSTQRDYMAGEVSKDLTRRILLPDEITQAHEQGIIHFHDSDFTGSFPSGKRPSDAFKRRDYCKTARQRIIYGWKILCGKKGKSSGNLYLMGCM